MHKIAFVIPYIGKFPNFFQLWLNSCAYNETIDWIIFTDDKTDYCYPKNVYVHFVTFKWLQEKIQANFDFKISLERPYRFCDFKPTYGEVFAEYLVNYDFWGYCDVDLIWGNLRKWLTEEMLCLNDRISLYGHCYILKNNAEINSLYRKEIPNFYGYKKALTEDRGFGFDEDKGVNHIYDYVKTKSALIPFFDIKVIYFRFRPSEMTKKFLNIKTKDNIFLISPGKVELVGYNNGIKTQEFAYVHMQKREMEINIPLNSQSYIIIPNKFVEIFEINKNTIHRVQPFTDFFYYHKKLTFGRIKRLLSKLKFKSL